VDNIPSVSSNTLCRFYLIRLVTSRKGWTNLSTAGIPDIANDLNTTDLIATLGVTTYVLGFAFGPLVWAPLSEVRGRRPVYLLSWTVFTIFQIPCALARNAPMLIICRFIAGTFGSSPLANAGGSLADIWLVDS